MPGPQQLVTMCFHNRRDAGKLAGLDDVGKEQTNFFV